jgi:endonuclease/exonuclease/phosphatase family metal-dependent hydrolase
MFDTSGVRRAIGRAALVVGVVACAAAPWPNLWLSDLLAAVAPWAAIVAAVMGAGLVLTPARRWAALPVALACSTAWLTLSAPRAPRSPARDGSITILVLNARAAPLDDTLAFLRTHQADIAVLVEAPWNLFRSAPEEAGYQWRAALGPQSGPGVRAILSKSPGEQLDAGLPDRAVFGAKVHLPQGPVAVVVAHPESPRSPARWREGNRRARQAAEFASRLEAGGVPTLIAADFNSPPTGWRSRMLGRAGFRRARPLWPPGGSYPEWAPGAVRLAIDGVAVGREFSVSSWRILAAPGSDHRAVLVTLALDRQ